MNITSSAIVLRDVRIFAHHGVLQQERTVGAYFYVNMRVDTDMRVAVQTDDIRATVSYADVFEIVRREMAVPSALLEHVAGRIANAVVQAFPSVCRVSIEVLKENPPMGADCRGAGVCLECERE